MIISLKKIRKVQVRHPATIQVSKIICNDFIQLSDNPLPKQKTDEDEVCKGKPNVVGVIAMLDPTAPRSGYCRCGGRGGESLNTLFHGKKI
jgi:hypothetical protein